MTSAIADAGGDVGLPRFVILPGAGHPLRRYPRDLLAPLIQRLRDEGTYQPLIIVDLALSEEWKLSELCRDGGALAGVALLERSTLREFMGLVSTATRALANDSGPGHMAVALGVPTDFVFGPGCVGDWHPYDRARHPLHRRAVDCRLQGPREREEFQFCTVDACAHQKCLRELAVRL